MSGTWSEGSIGAVPGRLVDLSLALEDGMATLPGVLPEARIRPLLDHEASRDRYQGKAEFLLGAVDMSTNVGTYVDSPFHRFRDREDLAAVPLERWAGIPGVVVDGPDAHGPVDIDLGPDEVRGRAVLVRTGWDRRWPEGEYWEPGPYLSGSAIDALLAGPAALVGVDFGNVDDTSDPVRPAHTRLLDAGVLIVERLTGLDQLLGDGFRFSAVPPRVVGGASFPVRAFAEVRPKRSSAAP
jgi:arylformamidase